MNEWVWSNGGMILTGENWSPGRKTLYSVGGRWMNEYGAMVEWYWQGKIEVLGEKHYTESVVDEWMSMEQWWVDTYREKLKYWEKICTSATLSTINPIWTGLVSTFLSLTMNQRDFLQALGHHAQRNKTKPSAFRSTYYKTSVIRMPWNWLVS